MALLHPAQLLDPRCTVPVHTFCLDAHVVPGQPRPNYRENSTPIAKSGNLEQICPIQQERLVEDVYS